jgi:hypothetical protein
VPRNLKGGFNRLFIVLTVLWALYCLVWYPFRERAKSQTAYNRQLESCYTKELGRDEAFKGCVRLAEVIFDDGQREWQLRRYYTTLWPFILLALVGVPLLFYVLVRVIAVVGVWIYRGYATGNRR